MFKHYLISTLRRLRRAEGFTGINIIGLSVGLTGAVLVLLLVQYELGFDRHNEKLDSLHIVINRVARPGGSDRHSPNVPMPLAPELLSQSPQIVRSARPISSDISMVVRYDSSTSLTTASQSFFERSYHPSLSYPLLTDTEVIVTDSTPDCNYGGVLRIAGVGIPDYRTAHQRDWNS